MSEPLTDAEVRQLAADWYAMLDVHAPVGGYEALLAPDVEFHFPEGVFRGLDDFRKWYDAVTHKFFDEIHTLKLVRSKLDGDSANVEVVVNWQASIWSPPAARSERIVADAYQTWAVRRSPGNGKAVISVYAVDSLDYAPGSATL